MSTTAAADTEKKRPLTAAEFIARMTGVAKERDEAIAKANAQISLLAVVATFLAIKPEELAAKKPEEVKTALEAKAGAACQADANNEAVKTAAAAKTTAEGKATAAEALTQVYVAGLSAVKVTAAPADTAKGLQASDVTAALNARMATLAGEKLAELGFPVAGLPQCSGTADEPTDLAAKLAHYNQLTDPKERDEYYSRVLSPALAKPGNN